MIEGKNSKSKCQISINIQFPSYGKKKSFTSLWNQSLINKYYADIEEYSFKYNDTNKKLKVEVVFNNFTESNLEDVLDIWSQIDNIYGQYVEDYLVNVTTNNDLFGSRFMKRNKEVEFAWL